MIETKGRHSLKFSAVKITQLRSEGKERLLVLWLEDLYAKNIPVGLALIQEKAMSLYEDLKKGRERSCKRKTIQGSKRVGGFTAFKKGMVLEM